MYKPCVEYKRFDREKQANPVETPSLYDIYTPRLI